MSTITTQLFRINSTWQRPPDNYQESPIPEVGKDLTGRPIKQGYREITFVWSFLDQEDLTRLLEVYDINDPAVTLRFIDKGTGVLIPEVTAMMHEPLVGGRNIIYYQNVTCKFSRIDYYDSTLLDIP